MHGNNIMPTVVVDFSATTTSGHVRTSQLSASRPLRVGETVTVHDADHVETRSARVVYVSIGGDMLLAVDFDSPPNGIRVGHTPVPQLRGNNFVPA